jgi:hypothetical protein
MKTMTILLLAGLLNGCGLSVPRSTMALMVNPKTGETARCRSLVMRSEELPANGPASVQSNFPFFTSRNLDNCVPQYEAGFVTTDALRKSKAVNVDKEPLKKNDINQDQTDEALRNPPPLPDP